MSRSPSKLLTLGLLIVLVFGAATAPAWSGPRGRPGGSRGGSSIVRLLRLLNSDEPAVRASAERRLAGLGDKALPALMKVLHGQDLGLVRAAQAALQKIAGKPGEPVSGVTLSALAVGSPRKGDVVTLWISLRNASKRSVYVLPFGWELVARPPGAKGPAFEADEDVLPERPLYARKGKPFGREVKPGESFSVLMDADPSDPAATPAKVVAHLRFYSGKRAPDHDEEELNAEAWELEQVELAAAPIGITYTPEPDAPANDYEKRLRRWMKALTLIGREGGEGGDGDAMDETDRLMLETRPDFAALRRALRVGDSDQRWRVYLLACMLQRTELTEDLVDFAMRWGPRTEPTGPMHVFVQALPRKERLPLFYRLALLRRGIGYASSVLALDYDSYYWPEDLAWVTRILLLESMDTLSYGERKFVAWQMFANPDPAIHNPKRALEIAKQLVEEMPRSKAAALALAMMQGKRDEVRRIAGTIDDAMEFNNIAWKLATAWRPEARDKKLGLELAQKAVDTLPADDDFLAGCMDTLACAQATAGDFKAAAKTMQEAWDAGAQESSKPIFAYRTLRFTGIAQTDPKLRAGSPTGIAGTAARDMLLAKLKSAKDEHMRRAASDLLRDSFPDDAAVLKALEAAKDAPKPAREDD